MDTDLGALDIVGSYNRTNDTLTLRCGWGCFLLICCFVFMPLLVALLVVIS